ncbi:S1 RNA-binding domain-containing protein [Anaeromicropila populeti]|uniref:Small subunit ribosomal protein S1 n=1 Tax=Anaeromicropila populeti TaxID=37658 RepID=A0A1I6LC22_9FIRM|nr:S1 RNA-binding domain-containing protein [Anaeromicropila populeti]SFS00984.1 small subunit ribosomal protein S1 [Anaeromicropila populeti]
MSDSLNNELTTEEEAVEVKEPIPSMDEFQDEINRSFRSINEGECITGTIIGITETEVMVDLGYYTEGIIKAEEASNDPSFSIKSDLSLGDSVTALVLSEDDGEGHIVLSLKKAKDALSWDLLKEAKKLETVYTCKIKEIVNGGVITYVEGIRGFIPASQLSLGYVDNLDQWAGKTVEAIIITVEEDKRKLILSAKEVEYRKEAEQKKQKISSLQVGLVTTGVIEKLMPYGVFVNIGENLSGLVHISQICGKHIKSPKEVVQEGQEVTVKIIDVKDGKISLSIKAVEEKAEIVEDIEEAPIEYISEDTAPATLGSLLSKFHFDS